MTGVRILEDGRVEVRLADDTLVPLVAAILLAGAWAGYNPAHHGDTRPLPLDDYAREARRLVAAARGHE